MFNVLKIVSYVIVLIGAINWGLVGFFGLNLVSLIFGDDTIMTKIIYDLVGLSAILLIFLNQDIFYNKED